jgi:hypothetical protein
MGQGEIWRVQCCREEGDLRVIDKSGEDYLYPSTFFVLIDLPRNTARALNKAYTPGFQRAG